MPISPNSAQQTCRSGRGVGVRPTHDSLHCSRDSLLKSARQRIRNSMVAIDELAFPRTCLGRGKIISHDGLAICAGCSHRHAPIAPQDQLLRLEGIAVWALFAFQGPLAQAIRRLKYAGERSLARPLGELLAQASVFEQAPDLMLPIPLHPWRRWQRGFNQADLLAAACGRALGGRVEVRNLVRRTRWRAPQASLSRAQRLAALNDAFELVPGAERAVRGRTVLLIDDVTTTGATMVAAARSLRRAGAKRCLGLALLRTCA